MYSGRDTLSLQTLFVYFLALPSLLHPSVLFNCFYLYICKTASCLSCIRGPRIIIIQGVSLLCSLSPESIATRDVTIRPFSDLKMSYRNDFWANIFGWSCLILTYYYIGSCHQDTCSYLPIANTVIRIDLMNVNRWLSCQHSTVVLFNSGLTVTFNCEI